MAHIEKQVFLFLINLKRSLLNGRQYLQNLFRRHSMQVHTSPPSIAWLDESMHHLPTLNVGLIGILTKFAKSAVRALTDSGAPEVE
jgi:hypothetical protein